MAGVSIIPRNGVYNAAKHAVVSLTETLAAEFAELAPGLRASVICPGLVQSRIHESAQGRTKGSAKPIEGQSKPVPGAEDHAISAELAAQRALQGIEEDRLYIFTNPGAAPRVRERFAAIERDLARAP